MALKQSFPAPKKQKISYSSGDSAHNQVKMLLKNLKEKNGAVIQIAITDRTTIELPAHLSQEEIDARIANYRKLHTSKI
ncbi:MAG: hypothetical protein LIP05_05070 [Tannerellaceae bacterium]|nr:hypothetical protein [Tannerellaceae bacterium]MCC8197236.1 hypothetical protein [Tannerellaceae bacterium]